MKNLSNTIVKTLCFLLMIASFASCNKKINTNPAYLPYNNFDQSSDVPINAGEGAISGALVGLAISPEAPGIGAVVGGAFNAAETAYEESPQRLIEILGDESVQVVQEGKRVTVIVPTDKYYLSDSFELNDLYYSGLNHIAQLVLRDSDGIIYVAGFSDSFSGGGTNRLSDRAKLSEERAESMADFLWANGVPLHRLRVKGYGERYDIANNRLVHGAAMNRRVEIQWETNSCPPLSGNICND